MKKHMVRAEVRARREESEELRRLVEGVGEPRRGADREGSRMKAAERWNVGTLERSAFTEPTLWGLVGHTPLIPVPSFHRSNLQLLLKAEWFNPGGSVKDRAALFILRDGVARGELPRKRLLDASSGNTAVAYAMLGAAAGVGVTACGPAECSPERQAVLPVYGAEGSFTEPPGGPGGANREARRLAT